MLTTKPSCVKCGVCAEACPIGIIRMDQSGPKMLNAGACVRCGHCVAICPHAALDHAAVPLSNQVALDNFPVLDPQVAARFLRSRRSIRRYKEDAVPKEELLQLLDIARFAPSGSNTQGLSYLVVTNRDLMQKLTSTVIDWLEEQISQGVAWVQRYAQLANAYRATGRDVVLRDAPHLIIALAPKDFPIGQNNTRYSLAYAELYAPSLGLGTCWAGFFEMCGFSGYPPLYDLLGIPKDMAITGAVMVGYPQYKYHRLVDRNPLVVDWR